jgi:hypothetical protein
MSGDTVDRTIDEHLPDLRRLFNNQERIMAVPLHVLILEDCALDVELMLDHLSRRPMVRL